MEVWNKTEQRILDTMVSRGFPGSVKTTVIWAIRKAEDSTEAAKEVEELLAKGATTKEMVKAVQKHLV